MTVLASSSIENSVGLPMLIGPVISRRHQFHQPVDKIVHIAERPRLRAVTVDCQIAAK